MKTHSKDKNKVIYGIIATLVFIYTIRNSMFMNAFPTLSDGLGKLSLVFRLVLIAITFHRMFSEKVNRRMLLIFIIMTVLVIFSYIYTDTWILFDSLFIAIFLGKNLCYEKIVISYYYPMIVAFVFVVGLNMIGIIPTLDIYRGSGITRLNPGFLHPNDFSRIIMAIVFLHVLKNRGKPDFVSIVLIVLSGLFVYAFPNSRAVTYCIFVLLYLILTRIFIITLFRRDSFCTKAFGIISVMIFALIICFVWAATVTSSFDSITKNIGTTFFSRFYLARLGLSTFGITPFGRNIAFAAEYSLKYSSNMNTVYYSLDCVYHNLLIARGIFPTIFILGIFGFNLYRSATRGYVMCLLISIVMMIYSVAEPGLMDYIFSFIFILPASVKHYGDWHKKIKLTSRYLKRSSKATALVTDR